MSSRALRHMGTTLATMSHLVLGPQLPHIEPEGVAWQLSVSLDEDNQICHEGPQVDYASFLVLGDLTIQPGTTVREEPLPHGPVHVTVPQHLGPVPLSHPTQSWLAPPHPHSRKLSPPLWPVPVMPWVLPCPDSDPICHWSLRQKTVCGKTWWPQSKAVTSNSQSERQQQQCERGETESVRGP